MVETLFCTHRTRACALRFWVFAAVVLLGAAAHSKARAAQQEDATASQALAAEEKEGCINNLRVIYDAIQAYQFDHKDVPRWLSDLVPDYLSTSYSLFNDAETFKGTLVQANIFSDTIFEDKFKGWENKFKVVHAGLFLHLFSWEQQVVVCEKIVKLLGKEKGSIFLGEMVGCKGGGERSGAAKFWKKGEERKQYLHDGNTFQKLWGEVAEKTDTKGCWKVEGWFKVRQTGNSDGSRGCAYFVGEGIGWFTFSVERI